MSKISLPHLDGARYFYSASGEDSGDWQELGAEHEFSQQIIARLGRLCRRVAEVPHDEIGVDIERINSFYERHGLTGKTFIGVDEVGQQDINEIMGFGREPTSTIASHFPLVGVTYVLRRLNDGANGPMSAEASVVHELGHAYQPYMDILIHRQEAEYGIEYVLLRNGFAWWSGAHRMGSYLEEGFGSLMAHRYITEECGLRHGLLDTAEPHKLAVASDETYLLPGSYLWDSGDGRVNWSPSAHAAYGLQLLIANDPLLFPAMIASRKDAESLDEFAFRVNNLCSGLYDGLSELSYEEMSFREATYAIIKELYEGDQNRAIAVASEQDAGELVVV